MCDPGQALPVVRPGTSDSSEAARSAWAENTARDPEFSQRYIDRFKRMADSGADLVGEARLADALVPHASAILDAGCGPGRHAGHLHRAGHTVVGVDLDPVLIAAAREDQPGPTYVVGDLVEAALPPGAPDAFDLVLCAGNVMTFLHPSTRRPVLTRFATWLAADGRALVGFGARRGYAFDDFMADAEASGLTVQGRWATWDLRPFAPGSDFLVALLAPAV